MTFAGATGLGKGSSGITRGAWDRDAQPAKPLGLSTSTIQISMYFKENSFMIMSVFYVGLLMGLDEPAHLSRMIVTQFQFSDAEIAFAFLPLLFLLALPSMETTSVGGKGSKRKHNDRYQ